MRGPMRITVARVPPGPGPGAVPERARELAAAAAAAAAALLLLPQRFAAGWARDAAPRVVQRRVCRAWGRGRRRGGGGRRAVGRADRVRHARGRAPDGSRPRLGL